MPTKPSLVTNTSPLVALVAALADFGVVGKVATLVVPGEVLAELRAGAEHDATAQKFSVLELSLLSLLFAWQLSFFWF